MAVSDIEAVLQFLRKNGLSDSESALMEDILDKSQLGSADFQRFLFPMVPPPPPLKLPANRVPPLQSDDDSSDEFVSMASSTTELCSSEFTNPYGVRTVTQASSQASSDRLSQFGTARDYHDFDMQNDMYWYKENDEDYDMPPSFGSTDPFGGPSEDKFVMTQGTVKQSENPLGMDPILDSCQYVDGTDYLDKSWPITSISDSKDEVQVTVYRSDPFKGNGKNNFHDSNIMVHKSTECGSSLDHKADGSCITSITRGSTYDLVGDSKSTYDLHSSASGKKLFPNRNGDYEAINGGEVGKEFNEQDAARDEEGGTTTDELLMYAAEEDEYEVFNLRIIHRKNRTGFEENKDLPIVLHSVIASRYYVTEYLGSAAFSKVVQAHDLQMRMDVCLKIIKNDKDFFDQSLDEIKLLKFVNKYDPGDERHILRLYDYFYYQEHLIIVCELLRANLYEFQKYNRESGGEPYFTLNRLQVITRQCLEALEYLHELGIIHCDLKPENILIKSYSRCELKVIDLGSSCFQTDNLSLYVQSRSYRAPEVILGLPYDQKIDLWSLGCILAELCSGEVLFPNEAVVFLLARMIGMLGPLDTEMLEMGQEIDKYFTKEFDLFHINEETNELEYIIPEESSLEHHLQVSDIAFTDFVRYLLEINPQRRPTAREALEHPWLSISYESNSC